MKIVKVTALGCMSCMLVENHLDSLKEKYDLNIESLDYDFDSEKVRKYNVGKKLPVLIFMNGDDEFNRTIGEVSERNLEDIISSRR